MRESIGATWIFTICLTFIVIFTAYLAVSVNYSKAFKIKSYIVGLIEEKKQLTSEVREDIETYLTAQGYSAYGECPDTIEVNGHDTDWQIEPNGRIDRLGSTNEYGVCIYSMDVETDNDDICAEKKYYKVIAFWKFDLPIVNIVLKPFQVSGESKYVIDLDDLHSTHC